MAVNRTLFKKIFGEEYKEESYKFVAHGPWIPLKKVGKSYCQGCGLLRLNNQATRWCIDKGCNYSLHPQYKNKMRKAGGIKWTI